MDIRKRFNKSDFVRIGLMVAIFILLLSVTLAVAGTKGKGTGEANTFFSDWHGVVVGVLIPLGAAGVAIGFIARAVSNARDGASPAGAVVGALITAGGAMLLPSIATLTSAGSSFTLVEVPRGASSFEPSLFYAFFVIRYVRSRFRYGRAR